METGFTMSFFSSDQKEAENLTDSFIRRKMKKIGVKQFLIRKHVHILVNDFDCLNFDEKDKLENDIKNALSDSKGYVVIFLPALQ